MIIPVSKNNEIEWADLNVELWSDNTRESILEEHLKGNREHEFLYYIETQAVAFISLSLRYDYVEGTGSSPVGYVEGIYVKPDFRNKGIAKELIEFAKTWSIEKGCSELASDCILSNEDSRAFHNKVGFKEANVIVCFTMDLRI